MSILSRQQVPANGLIFSAIIIAIAVLANFVVSNTSLFTFVSSVATTCFLFIWGAIVECHLEFKRQQKKQNIPEGEFKLHFHPWTAYLVLASLIFVAVILCLENTTLFTLIAAMAWFVMLYLICSLKKINYDSTELEIRLVFLILFFYFIIIIIC